MSFHRECGMARGEGCAWDLLKIEKKSRFIESHASLDWLKKCHFRSSASASVAIFFCFALEGARLSELIDNFHFSFNIAFSSVCFFALRAFS